jgi:hypothetical protein
MQFTLYFRIAAASIVIAGCTGSGSDQSAEVPFTEARGIALGVSKSQLLRVRPGIYVDSDAFRERLSSNDVLLYWFGSDFPNERLPKNRLVSVTLSSNFAANDSSRLLERVSEIRQEWSEQYGESKALSTRVLRRGHTRRELHAETWYGATFTLILAYELPEIRGDFGGELQLNRIAHVPRLGAEQVLPNR